MKTAQDIRKQVYALKAVLAKMPKGGPKTFPILGKIKKLEKQIEVAEWNEFLAK